MNGWTKNIHWQDAALPSFAIVSVLALLFPLANGLMDLLLAFNLALAATIFIATFFVRKPLEFSAFPTILLTTTLFRLVLNVSTTRLILTKGDAGQVIDAFSRFVAGDNIVVGAVIFLIFIIIQFVVITKGATRISEVSARFTLDALPGRQSAIDFDLNSGNISESEARRAREELSEQSDFFGAMDGASKFVRGDAVAGLAIVAINVIGGLCIGIMQRGLSIGEAAELYSKLTIGDGLVSQIPAFLISLATGLLVARSSRSQNVSNAAIRQTFGRPIVLLATGLFLSVMAFTGLPLLPLLTLSCGFFALAWAVSRNKNEATGEENDAQTASSQKSTERKKGGDEDDLDRYMTVDPMEIAIGSGLVSIAAPEDGPTLLDRVKKVRQTIASELGLILPKVRVHDDGSLDENQFVVKINGYEASLDVVYAQMALAVDAGYAVGPLQGLQTRAPGDGATAYWIDPKDAAKARDLGYDVLSAGEVVEQKTLDVVRREAANLLTRDAAKRLIERLREFAPTLVEETLGENESDKPRETAARLAKTQTVLQLLLREGASIRRLDVILEALCDLELREPGADVYRALEYVRVRLARFISAKYRDEDGVLRAAMLEPEAEDALRDALVDGGTGAPAIALPAADSNALKTAIADALKTLRENAAKPVLLVERSIRYALRDAMKSSIHDAVVLAFDEIDPSTKVAQETVVEWKPSA